MYLYIYLYVCIYNICIYISARIRLTGAKSCDKIYVAIHKIYIYIYLERLRQRSPIQISQKIPKKDRLYQPSKYPILLKNTQNDKYPKKYWKMPKNTRVVPRRGNIYPTRSVCTKNVIFPSRFEVLSNRAIPLPNNLWILLGNTNSLPRIVFWNSKNFGFNATLWYIEIAPEIISSASLLDF